MGKSKGGKGKHADAAAILPPKRKILCNNVKRFGVCNNNNCEFGHKIKNFDAKGRFWTDPQFDRNNPFVPPKPMVMQKAEDHIK